MTLIDHPSPNHSPRRPGVRVDTVLLHHTGTDHLGRWSDGGALNTLCNPKDGVSAHYLVETTGRVLRLVPEHLKAWHAGPGRLPWETVKPYDFNHRSIGVELVNPGDGVTPFTEAQYAALGELLPDIVRRINRPPTVVAGWQKRRGSVVLEEGAHCFVLGHRDVAPGRKTDPADNFDWGRVRSMLAGRAT